LIIYVFPENYLIEENFKQFPQNKLTAYLLFIDKLFLLLPVFTNFIAFFYMIKEDYKPAAQKLTKTSLYEKDILRISRNNHSNTDIDQYLKI
jgi:hypothetical protein